jgi:hypothetical protein
VKNVVRQKIHGLQKFLQKFLVVLVALMVKKSSAVFYLSRQRFDGDKFNYPPSFTNFASSAENYVGPSSYKTSFGSDYPGFGNFGSLMNVKSPQISSSYSSFGPSSDNSEFGSTSYTNYPQNVEYERSKEHKYSHQFSSESFPPHSSSVSETSSQYSESPISEHTISQHVEVTKPIVVPVYKRFPYPVAKRFPVAIPHPGKFQQV